MQSGYEKSINNLINQDQAKTLHKTLTLQSLTLTSICMNAEFLLAY